MKYTHSIHSEDISRITLGVICIIGLLHFSFILKGEYRKKSKTTIESQSQQEQS